MENREAIEVLQRNAVFCDAELEDAINLAISALKKQEVDRWHSVAKEGNPKKSGSYVVTTKMGNVVKDYYYASYDEWVNFVVVAWKKKSEPYKVEEEQL